LATDASTEIDTSLLLPNDEVQFQEIDRPLVLDGRLPDPDAADEVVLSELAVENLALHTGDRLQVTTFGRDDCRALAEGDFQGFTGPAMDLSVVGEVRVLEELQGSDIEAGPVVIGTPALRASMRDEACTMGVFATARYEPGGGPTDAELSAATRRAAPEVGEVGAGSLEAEFLESVHSAVDVAITALLVFALVTGVAGLLALVQAVARQVASPDGVGETLGAVGLTRNQRALAVTLPLLVAGVLGALAAVAGAVAMSPLFPLGVARRAEPDPGIRVDPLVLGTGVVVLVLLVGVAAFLIARRPLRRREAVDRRSTASGTAARSGAPPVVVVGLRLADDRSRGRSAVRTAAIGTGVALAGVCAVLVLSSSLHTVLDEPQRFGWPWTSRPDMDSDDPEATIAGVAEDEDVAAVGVVNTASVVLDGTTLEGWALTDVTGTIEFPLVEGREPTSPSEVALGVEALDDVGLGDTVSLTTAEDRPVELQVVGRTVLPHLDSAGGNTAHVVPELLATLGVDVEESLVLTYAEGVDAGALEARLEEEHGLLFPTYARPNPPGRLVHLDAIGSLLAALAGFFALLGLVGLVHAVATSARRHQGFFATLRSLGFVRHQVVRSVVVSGLAIVAVGALVGVPAGIAAGRVAWLAAIGDVGIVEDPTVPGAALVAVVLGAVLVVAGVAAAPAWQASRHKPAELLRVE
ncbi:MAG TPA: FtsX-like permease family protein, partial [Acidimicrobiales bacterium]|nr:FtsX-like permease family protein [Acidimicrobiales bacterium]